MASFDHIILGCEDLETGITELTERLGAPPSGRGKHAMMSTWNALWNMGEAYLELVAIDPAAPDPGRPRWFGLDDPAMQARLAERVGLITWAVAGPLEPILAAAPAGLGPAEAFARDDLTWRVAVPVAGAPLLDGAFPLTLHWTGGLHPAKRLPDAGIRCLRFDVRHKEAAAITRAIGEVGPPVSVAVGDVALTAEIEGPGGRVVFSC